MDSYIYMTTVNLGGKLHPVVDEWDNREEKEIIYAHHSFQYDNDYWLPRTLWSGPLRKCENYYKINKREIS